jgi:hypothetical protein
LQNLPEHLSGDGNFGHLEGNIATVAHHLRASGHADRPGPLNLRTGAPGAVCCSGLSPPQLPPIHAILARTAAGQRACWKLAMVLSNARRSGGREGTAPWAYTAEQDAHPQAVVGAGRQVHRPDQSQRRAACAGAVPMLCPREYGRGSASGFATSSAVSDADQITCTWRGDRVPARAGDVLTTCRSNHRLALIQRSGPIGAGVVSARSP